MLLIKLLFRNTFRHRLRTFLTVLAISIAVLAFGMLNTLVGLWYMGAEHSSVTRLVTRNAISLIFPLPIAYKDRIRQIPGVKNVSWGNWFGGIYLDERNFFANEAMDPRSFLELYPEFLLPQDQKDAFIHDRKGCIVGRKLAERYGWRIGDLITLKGTIFPGQWEFVLRGIYVGAEKGTDERALIFQWDYLNETLKKTVPRRADQVGFFMVQITRPDLAAQVARSIDSIFRNSMAETMTETEKAFHLSFVAMTEAILIIIQVVSYMVIVIIMAVAANTMAMTARERIGEFAVFKALGFHGYHIALIVLGESMIIALAGGLTGVLVTFPAAHWLETELDRFFPAFQISSSTMAIQMTSALLVGFVSALFPVWRAINIKIADGMRRIG